MNIVDLRDFLALLAKKKNPNPQQVEESFLKVCDDIY
jgi:hypothetical protein